MHCEYIHYFYTYDVETFTKKGTFESETLLAVFLAVSRHSTRLNALNYELTHINAFNRAKWRDLKRQEMRRKSHGWNNTLGIAAHSCYYSRFSLRTFLPTWSIWSVARMELHPTLSFGRSRSVPEKEEGRCRRAGRVDYSLRISRWKLARANRERRDAISTSCRPPTKFRFDFSPTNSA